MEKNNIIDYKNPSQNLVTDVLSDFLRSSAQKMLQLAIEEEVQNFITSYQDKLLTNGNKQIVRNGYLPERTIQTGIGEMAVKVPRVRDRGEENIKFTSNLIPQYMRRTVTIDVLLPLLYLKGISTTDFAESFEPILGSRPKNLSPNVISRLKAGWYDQYLTW
jgi:transposase-like protein